MKNWIKALRLYSATCSIMPALLGIAAAIESHSPINLFFIPLVIFGTFFIHMGANLFNDYYDYIYEVDAKENFGSTNVLVEGLFKPAQILNGAILFTISGVILGIPILITRGPVILLLVIIGIMGSYFYNAKPLRFKAKAIGEILMIFLMGPLILCGSYFALTGSLTLKAVLLSFPFGFLVASILNANNLRDRENDSAKGTLTISNILDFNTAKNIYFLLLSLPYLIIIVSAILNYISILYLIILASLPYCLKIMIKMFYAKENSNDLNSAVFETAKLHLFFGILLLISAILDFFIFQK